MAISCKNAAPAAVPGLKSRMPLTPDGALLASDPSAEGAGSTERLLFTIARRLGLSHEEIHQALEQGTAASFEQTALYQRVFELADHRSGRRLPRAVLPSISLEGPKIERSLTTGWYARRVNGRFERCVRG